ncbi:MAG TPA: DUF5698 domain-containing protein [Acidimicrobiia bacterium]|nr:DUF5698 domain-containing protein [Acidimicrobiia bacterium]
MLLDILFTAGLATVCVSLWTVRLAVTARGNRGLSAVIAGMEAMLFVVAFAKILNGLDSVFLVAAYGAGVGGGTLLGLALDARLNPQLSRLDVFDPTGDAIEAIEAAGFAVTKSEGIGTTGRVIVGSVISPDLLVGALLESIGHTESTWTVSPVRRATGSQQVRGRGGMPVVPGPTLPGHRLVRPTLRSGAVARFGRRVKAARRPSESQPAEAPHRTHAAAHV